MITSRYHLVHLAEQDAEAIRATVDAAWRQAAADAGVNHRDEALKAYYLDALIETLKGSPEPPSPRDVFKQDMTAAGLKVIDYTGRDFYSGPAVVVTKASRATTATKVACRVDGMGADFVVYPRG